MKVAVSASGRDLDSQIDPCFGRCAFFLVVETDGMNFESFNNENIACLRRGLETIDRGDCEPERGIPL